MPHQLNAIQMPTTLVKSDAETETETETEAERETANIG